MGKRTRSAEADYEALSEEFTAANVRLIRAKDGTDRAEEDEARQEFQRLRAELDAAHDLLNGVTRATGHDL